MSDHGQEIAELSRYISDRATRLQLLLPKHPLLVWYKKLWVDKAPEDSVIHVRKRLFVHRFITDKQQRKKYGTDSTVVIETYVEYISALENVLVTLGELKTPNLHKLEESHVTT